MGEEANFFGPLFQTKPNKNKTDKSNFWAI